MHCLNVNVFICHLASRLNAGQVAEAVYMKHLEKPLEKYFSTVPEHLRLSASEVIDHLTACIVHGMSSNVFLDHFFEHRPIIWNDKFYADSHMWTLTTDKMVYAACTSGLVFSLRQGEVKLMVSLRQLPYLYLTEDRRVPKKLQRFVLTTNAI